MQNDTDANLSSLQVEYNIDQSSPGNATINMIHGEMWFHNDSTDGVLTTINTQNIWVNVTGFNQIGTDADQTLNGFAFNALGEYLEAQVAGKYKVDYSMSFGNTGNNQEYQIVIAVNDVLQNSTDTHRKIGTAGDVGNVGGLGFIDLAVGDIITLMIRDNDGTANVETHAATVNLIRIGD